MRFDDTTLTGLAGDGGLYVPATYPKFSEQEIADLRNLDYVGLSVAILKRFSGDTLSRAELTHLAGKAYGGFHHDAVAPIKQLDDHLFFMELFHGPTLAFKDYALQMLGQLFEFFLKQNNASATILGATSGDTGSAAIAGLRGLASVELYMLHPDNRVSEVQRRQMTTVMDGNIHNLAVDGTFDDCQNLAKTIFNDLEFKEKHALSSVNSINWARIAAQVVYYFRAALALGAPHRAVNFSVPTGNFGNVLAGFVAWKMGLPIHKLIIGSNSNDILTRFFHSGTMQKKGVKATLSPSMDIQISSNFERFLFELLERDSEQLNQLMSAFSQQGQFSVCPKTLRAAQQKFSAYRFDDHEVQAEIHHTWKATGEIIDPHSCIGVAAARRENDRNHPTIVIGTAHPAKFPQAIKQAVGKSVPLPEFVGDLMHMEERYQHVANNADDVKAIISGTPKP